MDCLARWLLPGKAPAHMWHGRSLAELPPVPSRRQAHTAHESVPLDQVVAAVAIYERALRAGIGSKP